MNFYIPCSRIIKDISIPDKGLLKCPYCVTYKNSQIKRLKWHIIRTHCNVLPDLKDKYFGRLI